MSEFLDYLSASDNEIYDLLVSGRQRLTENVLREFARDRGIFCSSQESREDLADYLSILPHSYHDIAGIIDRREPVNRKERTTSVRLKTKVEQEELKAAVKKYTDTVAESEHVVYRPKGKGGGIVNVEYDEFNRSRTRLLQRVRQKVEIEFFEQDDQTMIVRMTATEKSTKVMSSLKTYIEEAKKEKISEDAIELTNLKTPELRSRFFTKLISSLPGFNLRNVMSLKVSSDLSEEREEDETLDLEDEVEAGAEMFAAVVHSMHLSGQNLVQSPEYKNLIERGFYITEITWRSEGRGSEPDVVQFDAGFQDRKKCTGFKYSVQGVFRAYKGGHKKTIAPVDGDERLRLLGILESTARKVLEGLERDSILKVEEPIEVQKQTEEAAND